MNVEDPELSIASVAKAVTQSRRCNDPCPGAGSKHLVAERKLRLALEHIEGVGVIVMGVWFYGEPGTEAQVYSLELGQLHKNPVVARAAPELFPFVGTNVDTRHLAEYRGCLKIPRSARHSRGGSTKRYFTRPKWPASEAVCESAACAR